MFHVDGGGKGFERVVVEAVERGQQAQVFGYALGESLSEGVILDGERDVVAEHFKSVERVFFVEGIPLAAPESDYAGQLATNFQGAYAFEEFGCDIAVRT